MADSHKNFAYSTVATAPSPATTGTSLVVAAGDGTKFPTVSFNATVWPTGTQPTTANAEIVRVTTISTDTFTITRAQESSTARSVIVGDQIAATITALTLTDAEAAPTVKVFNAIRAIDAATGSVNYAHGLGKTPAFARCVASFGTTGDTSLSNGAYDGTTQVCQSSIEDQSVQNVAEFVRIHNVSQVAQQIGTVSWDATNITISWTKNGAATGNIKLQFEVWG